MYPCIKAVVYYNSKEQDLFLNLSNEKYEIRFFICESETVQTLIPITDLNLTLKMYGDSLSYKIESAARYLYTIGVGEVTLETLYQYGDKLIKDTFYLKVFVPSYYPRLKINFFNNGTQHLKYFDISNNEYEIQIVLQFSETESITIPIGDDNLQLYIFDKNCFYQEREINIGDEEHPIYVTKRFINVLEKGSCLIGLYYKYGGQEIFLKEEILIYESFFRNYFARHGFCAYDYLIYESNKQFKVVFDTLLEFIDILYAYYDDMGSINNCNTIKSKCLSLLGASLGFEKKSLYNDTKWEFAYTALYRELLYNLIDLIQLRGTKLSYELFFGALGYDLELLEYWFDTNGNLIEINYDDLNNSTFYAYTTEGLPLEDIPIPHVDPRKDVSAQNAYNYCNKSKYVRVVLTLKFGMFHPGNDSMTTERILIRQYLEWLRPNNIEYLQEIYKQNITRYGSGLYDVGENINTLIDSYDAKLNTANLYEIERGIYISSTEVYTEMIPLTIRPFNPGYPYWVPPPGMVGNLEFSYYGPWHSNSTPYGDTRGICIEYLKTINENVIIGGVINLIDSIESIIKYDLIDPYKYDGADEKSVGIKYDKGIIFYEKDLSAIKLNDFKNIYSQYLKTHTETETLEYMADYYDISKYLHASR